MAKAARLKKPAETGWIAQSREDAATAIIIIGNSVRERTRIEAAMGDEIAAVRARFEAQAAPHATRIAELTRGVQAWCEAHRDALTDGGRTKTANLGTGEVKWRMTPPKVSIRAADMVLALLKEKQLTRFIRVTEEVSKEAILADRAAVEGIPGITVTQAEEFIIEPADAELAPLDAGAVA